MHKLPYAKTKGLGLLLDFGLFGSKMGLESLLERNMGVANPCTECSRVVKINILQDIPLRHDPIFEEKNVKIWLAEPNLIIDQIIFLFYAKFNELYQNTIFYRVCCFQVINKQSRAWIVLR
uniref:Uncharacterized protein n=1 Tax=Cacopsylla melanoneura TaxID=428564 RepID=A0A8D8X3W0_9HEMI